MGYPIQTVAPVPNSTTSLYYMCFTLNDVLAFLSGVYISTSPPNSYFRISIWRLKLGIGWLCVNGDIARALPFISKGFSTLTSSSETSSFWNEDFGPWQTGNFPWCCGCIISLNSSVRVLNLSRNCALVTNRDLTFKNKFGPFCCGKIQMHSKNEISVEALCSNARNGTAYY